MIILFSFEKTLAICSFKDIIDGALKEINLAKLDAPIVKVLDHFSRTLGEAWSIDNFSRAIKKLTEEITSFKKAGTVDITTVQNVIDYVRKATKTNPDIIAKYGADYLHFLATATDYLAYAHIKGDQLVNNFLSMNELTLEEIIFHSFITMSNIPSKHIAQHSMFTVLQKNIAVITNNVYGSSKPSKELLRFALLNARKFPSDSPFREEFFKLLYQNWGSKLVNLDSTDVSLEYLNLIEEFIEFGSSISNAPKMVRAGVHTLKQDYPHYLWKILNKESKFSPDDITPSVLNKAARVLVLDILSDRKQFEFGHGRIIDFLDVCANEKLISEETNEHIFNLIYKQFEKEFDGQFNQKIIEIYLKLTPNAQAEIKKHFPKNVNDFITDMAKDSKAEIVGLYPPISEVPFSYGPEDLKWVDYLTHSSSSKAREVGILPKGNSPLFNEGETEITSDVVKRRWAIKSNFSIKNVSTAEFDKAREPARWASAWSNKTLLHNNGEVDSWASLILPPQLVADSTSEMALQFEALALARLLGGDTYEKALKYFATRVKKVQGALDGLGDTMTIYFGNSLYKLDIKNPFVIAGIKAKFKTIIGDPDELHQFLIEIERQVATTEQGEKINQIKERLLNLKNKVAARRATKMDLNYLYKIWIKEGETNFQAGMRVYDPFFNPKLHSPVYGYLDKETIYSVKDNYKGTYRIVKVKEIDKLTGELKVVGLRRGPNGYVEDDTKLTSVKIEDLYLTVSQEGSPYAPSNQKFIHLFQGRQETHIKLTFDNFHTPTPKRDYNNAVSLGAIVDPLARDPIILPRFKARPGDTSIGFKGDNQFVEIDPNYPDLPNELKEFILKDNPAGIPKYFRLKITTGRATDLADNYLFLALETTDGKIIHFSKQWPTDSIQLSHKSKEHFMNNNLNNTQDIGADVWQNLVTNEGSFPDSSYARNDLRDKFEQIKNEQVRYDFGTFVVPESPKKDLPFRRYSIDEYQKMPVTRERIDRMPSDVPFSVIINQYGQIRMAPMAPGSPAGKTVIALSNGDNLLSAFTIVKSAKDRSQITVKIGNGFYPDIKADEKQMNAIRTVFKNYGFNEVIFI